MKNTNAVIGRLDWDACEDCTHYDHSQGCEYDATYHGGVPVSVDGDFVCCDFYEENASTLELDKAAGR